MHPELHTRFASERLKDDHDGLEQESEGTATFAPESITIRLLREDDVPAVRLLAQLEDRPVPPGRLLLAEVEGTIEAAISLEARETVANPFAESAVAVSLLHVRAAQLRAA
jgi:hypothetical protein